MERVLSVAAASLITVAALIGCALVVVRGVSGEGLLNFEDWSLILGAMLGGALLRYRSETGA